MHKTNIKSIQWNNQTLILLDQRLLPGKESYLELTCTGEVVESIQTMVVRGAPAIGITAAYGVVLAAINKAKLNAEDWKDHIQEDMKLLWASRPTAVNLHWALARMQRCIDRIEPERIDLLEKEALAIHGEDLQNNYTMASLGAEYISFDANIITHCNTGSLATGGYGTALGVIRAAHEAGKLTCVYAGETRPWLQGARLTVWELLQDEIPVTLMCDSAAACLFKQTKIQWLIVGADRIAANGDVANKIGTYSLAVLAKYHQAKVMVVAPSSTIDLNTQAGCEIPIECREGSELFALDDSDINLNIWNPVFDITPASLIDLLVTEKGVIENPSCSGISALMSL